MNASQPNALQPGTQEANALGAEPLLWTRLPFTFDPEQMQLDLQRVPEDAWVPHFNSRDYAGEWSSVALRSPSGRPGDIVATSHDGSFHDTPLMSACPHLRNVVQTFAMPLKAVRLMRLHPGSRIREHRDRDLGLLDGEVRIHVPVVTSEQVEFVVANRRLLLRAGECWYIDFSQPHRIANTGKEHRVHLVLDGTVNSWVSDLLVRSAREIVTESFVPEGVQELARFRDLVYADADLRDRLLAETDAEALIAATVWEGERRGFGFGAGDTEALLQRNREEWMLRQAHL